jgi:hypothetical protein
MENRFNNNRDFEQFVKQNADQYRMFPSEKVWNGIHNSLHTRRRWYGIGLGLLILTTGVVTWVMLNTTGKNKQVVSTLPEITNQQPIQEKKQHSEVVIAPLKDASNKNSFVIYPDNLQKNLYIAQNTNEPAIEENKHTTANIPAGSPSVTFNQSDLINHSNPPDNQSEFIVKTTIVPAKLTAVNQDIPSVNLTSANDNSFLITNNTKSKESLPVNTEKKIFIL